MGSTRRSRATKPPAGIARKALRWHTLVFVLINLFLAALNLATSPSVLWFLWVTGAWGIALILHAYATMPDSDARPERTARAADLAPPVEDVGSLATRLSTRPAAPRASLALDGSDAPTNLATPSDAGSHELSGRASALQVGQRLSGRFVIERALGRGGMGEVYLARDEVLGDHVALKTITTSLVGSAALDRFRREAQAARRITHPNVVRIHDIGQDADLCFISMEYIEGQTLGARVRSAGPLPTAEVKRIALQLTDALEAAHAAGVTHRDLKPENILLDGNDQVRVIDFGLARLESSPGLTATGAVMGTPDYMAPEQILGKPADARTDMYAMGCVLHYALLGAPPFAGDSAMAVGVAHCFQPPRSLLESRPDLPPAWDALVLRALDKLAEKRFQTASLLREALQAL